MSLWALKWKYVLLLSFNLNKKVNWGKLKIVHKKEFIQGQQRNCNSANTSESFEVSRWAVCKEERIQIESVKIKNKWAPALRIPWADKTSQVTNKAQLSYFVRSAWPGSVLVHSISKTSQGVDIRQPLANSLSSLYYQFSVNLACTENQSHGSLSFVFLRVHA